MALQHLHPLVQFGVGRRAVAAVRSIRRAEEAMKADHLGAEEVATAAAALQKSLAQLHVKRRRHG